jgi:hypothetical protein
MQQVIDIPGIIEIDTLAPVVLIVRLIQYLIGLLFSIIDIDI